MRAAVFEEHGDANILKIVDVETPNFSDHEVLIEVKAFALNRLDIWTREGFPSLKLKFPHIGGSDFSGIIKEKGKKVKGFKIGDKVAVNPGLSCGHCHYCVNGEISLCSSFKLLGEHVWGGAAEYAIAPGENLIKLPEHVIFLDAAAISLTALTTYRMIKTKANVLPGEKVLVIGSGGGIGTMAIQLAEYFGAEVLALTSSKDKIKTAKELGASYVLNYIEEPEWSEKIWEYTGKKGVDVIIDSSGEAMFKLAIKTLAKGGRYVTCGATTGISGELNLALLFWKQLSILGSTMASHKEFKEVMNLFFSGKIMPVIDRIYEFDQIIEAHQYMENPSHIGKIVIKM